MFDLWLTLSALPYTHHNHNHNHNHVIFIRTLNTSVTRGHYTTQYTVKLNRVGIKKLVLMRRHTHILVCFAIQQPSETKGPIKRPHPLLLLRSSIRIFLFVSVPGAAASELFADTNVLIRCAINCVILASYVPLLVHSRLHPGVYSDRWTLQLPESTPDAKKIW